MKLVYTTGKNADFAMLCAELDAFLNEIAGGVQNRLSYIPLNQCNSVEHVVLLYSKDEPIGCVGLRRFSSTAAEAKRLYIKPYYRGKGLSYLLFKEIENIAANQGYTKIILETGHALKAAMQLFKAMGYSIIPNYGPYRGMKYSVCMEKDLHPNK